MPGLAPARWLAHPYMLLLLTTLFWAGNALVARVAPGEVSPMVLTSARWLVALAAMVVVAAPVLRREATALRRHARFMLGMGALGYTAFNALFYAAGHGTTAINIALLQGSIPIFVLVGAVVLLRERLTPWQLAGTAMTLLGVLLVASDGSLEVLLGLRVGQGDVLMLLACMLYAGYTLGLRRRPPLSALAFFSGMALAALITSLPLAVAEVALGHAYWPTLKGWLLIAYVGLLPSLLSQLFYMQAVQAIGAFRAGLFVNLVPIFGAFLAVLLLGERFALHHGLALALVVGGILLSELNRPRGRA